MSYIKSITVEGLAGRETPFSRELHRDVNIFFGLNGTGKTTLLRLMAAALSGSVAGLETAAFAKASVTVHSDTYDTDFVYSLDKAKLGDGDSERKTRRVRTATDGGTFIEEFLVPANPPKKKTKWVINPRLPEGFDGRWQHEFLSVHRLYHGAEGDESLVRVRIDDARLDRGYDRPFYRRVIGAADPASALSYELLTSRDIDPSAQNGKSALKDFVIYLDTQGGCTYSRLGKTTSVIALLDKDVDDLTGRQLVHPAVVYTVHYSHENHLFRSSVLSEGVAAAAGLTLANIGERLRGGNVAWCNSVTADWKEWIVMCLVCAKYEVSGFKNYGREFSLSHDRCSRTVVATARAEGEKKVRANWTSTSRTFDEAWNECSAIVDGLAVSQQLDAAFNGKWYFFAARCEVEVASPGRDVAWAGFPERLRARMEDRLDTECPELRELVSRVQRVSGLLPLS